MADLDKKFTIRAEADLGDAKDEIKSFEDQMKDSLLDRATRERQINDILKEQISNYERATREFASSSTARNTTLKANLKEVKTDVDKQKLRDEFRAEEEQNELNKVQIEILKDIRDELRTGKRINEEGVREDSEFAQRVREKFDSGATSPISDPTGSRGAGPNAGYMRTGLRVMGKSLNNPISGMAGIASDAGAALMVSGSALTGGILLAVGMLFKKVIDETLPTAREQLKASALTGSKVAETGNGDVTRGGYAQYGYSPKDYAALLSDLARSRRSGIGLGESAENQMLLNVGIGLDEKSYQNIEKTSLVEGKTGLSNIQSMIAMMKDNGMVKDGDYSGFADNLNIIAELSKNQMIALQHIDTGVNTAMVGAIAGMDVTLSKNNEALYTMVTMYKGTIGESSSPQDMAVKYGILQKRHPGMGLYEMGKILENPALDPGFGPEYFKQMRSFSGNDENYLFNMKGRSKGGYANTEKMAMGALKESFGEDITKDWGDESGMQKKELKERARENVPFFDKLSKVMSSSTTFGYISNQEKVAQQSAAQTQYLKEIRDFQAAKSGKTPTPAANPFRPTP